MIREVGTVEEFAKEVSTEGVVIVKFGAPWCQPCKTVDAILQEVAEEVDNTIVKVSVDELAELAGEFGVMSIPSIFVMQNAKEVSHFTGFVSKEDLMDEIVRVAGEL